jgi:hypothetical protein
MDPQKIVFSDAPLLRTPFSLQTQKAVLINSVPALLVRVSQLKVLISQVLKFPNLYISHTEAGHYRVTISVYLLPLLV